MSLDNKIILEKIEQLDSKVDNIDKTLAVNTQILEEHQRRSLALEKIVENNEQELKPIKLHIDTMRIGFKAVMWFCGAIAGFAGFIYLLKSLGLF